MKKFLFKNDLGSILLVIVISIITLSISTTLCLILFGIGIMGIDYTNDFGIPTKVYATTITIWTLINIVVYILVTIKIWINLLLTVDDKYNPDNDEK